MTCQPKHPIDMICTVCNALAGIACALLPGQYELVGYILAPVVATDGQGCHLARVQAAQAANQIAQLIEDNHRLRELVELQTRTLERTLRRWKESEIAP